MKYYSHALLIFLFYSLTSTAFALGEIHLKDIQCKIISSDLNEVTSKEGSLIDAICINDNNKIICSYTTKNGKMVGNKPSNITKYDQIYSDSKFLLWSAPTGIYIISLTKKRYSFAGIYIAGKGLYNKNCVGIITN